LQGVFIINCHGATTLLTDSSWIYRRGVGNGTKGTGRNGMEREERRKGKVREKKTRKLGTKITCIVM